MLQTIAENVSDFKNITPNQVGLFFKAMGQTDISVSTLHNADLNFNYNKKCIHRR